MEEETPKFVCATCGKPVIVITGVNIRGCEHEQAGIIANMAADTFGVGSMQEEE